LHGVSESQHSRRPQGAHLLPPIPNGVDLNFYRPRGERPDHVLFLGRICPEKAPHLAIEAASRAGAPLILAGQVFAYDAHLRYFAEEVQPRLGPRARFEGPVGPARKQTLLAAARCLLVPSLAEETSSLAAMEALACGAPVVGFRRGALPEIVEHGRTGFLVSDEREMAEAITQAGSIDRRTCRRFAETHLSSERMTMAYLHLYEHLLSCG
jgi:glycosyltransferase involved in cell wall biosynthesis